MSRFSDVAHNIFCCSLLHLVAGPMLLSNSLCAEAAQEGGLSLSEALRSTLSANPAILLQEQAVVSQQGAVQIAQGEFDTVLNAGTGYNETDTPIAVDPPVGPEETTTETAFVDVGASKRFRSGLSASLSGGPSFSFNDLQNNERQNSGSVTFSLNVPLLRGLGYHVAAANEIAQNYLLEAAKADLRHSISIQLLNTTRAYWDYVAAYQVLQAYQESEERSREFVHLIDRLVEADERPASDLIQPRADLASRMAARIQAEQSVTVARHNLAISMGIPFSQFDLLPPPLNPFPTVVADEIPSSGASLDLRLLALNERDDLKQAQYSLQASETVVYAARHDLRPQLDLGLQASYSGLETGRTARDFFHGLTHTVSGPSVGATLTFEWPYRNNLREGSFLQARAQERQSEIVLEDLSRIVQSDVSLALSSLHEARMRLEQVTQATQLFRDALQGERRKLELDATTILDVLSTEANLTQTLLQYIAAQNDVARALARLRQATGTLLLHDASGESYMLADPTTIPPITTTP